MKKGMLLAAELLLWAAFAVCALLCAVHLYEAGQVPEAWSVLAPERFTG